MQDNNYIVNIDNNHIMDRNLYQQCDGAHVFRKMVTSNYRVFCVCICVYVCALSRVRDYFPVSYTFYKCNVCNIYTYTCIYVFLLFSSIKCGPFVFFFFFPARVTS